MSDASSTPSLQQQIEVIVQEYLSYGEAGKAYFASIRRLVEVLMHQDAARKTLQAGMCAPDFTLPASDGNTIKLSDLWQRGAVVVTFFRGGWCPFCSLTLRAYDVMLPRVQQLGASMVALSPQSTQHSRNMGSFHFPLLHDYNNAVARQYGLVYTVPEFARRYVDDLVEYNQTDTWELPIAGTFVVDRSGTITLAYVNPDYVRRLEPATILAELRRLRA